MKILIDKQYRTRDGRNVRIYATDGGDGFPVHAGVQYPGGSWGSFCFKEDGTFSTDGTIHNLDLIEVSPWAHINVDDKVLVGSTPSRVTYRRYFAGVDAETGKPLTWPVGRTSWTTLNENDTERWDCCELATE